MVDVFQKIRQDINDQARYLRKLRKLLTNLQDEHFPLHAEHLAGFDPFATVAEDIDQKVNEDLEIEKATSQIELIDRLHEKAKLAMDIITLEVALARKTPASLQKDKVEGNIKSDFGEVPVLVFQYRRACQSYNDNIHAEFLIDEESILDSVDEIERQYEPLKYECVPADIDEMPASRIILALSNARLQYVVMSRGENQNHLELADSRLTQAMFLLKAWDEGISPRHSAEFIAETVHDIFEKVDDALVHSEDRISTMRKFMSKVYDMMGEKDTPSFKADRFWPVPLNTMSKIPS